MLTSLTFTILQTEMWNFEFCCHYPPWYLSKTHNNKKICSLYELSLRQLRYIIFSPSNHFEACFISIIWNRSILQFTVQSLTGAFCSWPSCRESGDWLVIGGVLLERWCHLLLFAWCLHSGYSLWWFFFLLWRSCWSSLQNSTSLPFLQDIQLAVSRCVPAASISSLLWWSTAALFLWSYTAYCWIFYVTTGSQWPFSAVFYENCSVFSGHSLTHPRFCSCTTVHFLLVSCTAGFWLSISFFN